MCQFASSTALVFLARDHITDTQTHDHLTAILGLPGLPGCHFKGLELF